MKKTLLFLDIDGVFSIATPENQNTYEFFLRGLPAWPIPLASAFLRAIDAERRLYPVWLSSWGIHSPLWNTRAETRLWPIGYHLFPRQMAYAKKILPAELFDLEKRIDRKLIAVRYFLRKYANDQKIIWIEDGFADETEAWAQERGNVALIDTTIDPVYSLFLTKEDQEEQALAGLFNLFFPE